MLVENQSYLLDGHLLRIRQEWKSNHNILDVHLLGLRQETRLVEVAMLDEAVGVVCVGGGGG